MRAAQRAILDVHAFAKEIKSLEDIALCHAIGQACGVDAEAGITAQSCEDAAVKRLIAARAARVAVAADSAKLGTAAPFSVIALAACDHLCIEAGTPAPVRDTLAAAGPILIEVET